MESYYRDLLDDVAEHRSLEKEPKYVLARFSFTPKTGIAFPRCFALTVQEVEKSIFYRG